jgi:hypothetical protein
LDINGFNDKQVSGRTSILIGDLSVRVLLPSTFISVSENQFLAETSYNFLFVNNEILKSLIIYTTTTQLHFQTVTREWNLFPVESDSRADKLLKECFPGLDFEPLSSRSARPKFIGLSCQIGQLFVIFRFSIFRGASQSRLLQTEFQSTISLVHNQTQNS